MAGKPPVREEDGAKARRCLECPVCAHARRKQGGPIYWFVTEIGSRFCPHCQAYERVYGRKAHEPLPSGTK